MWGMVTTTRLTLASSGRALSTARRAGWAPRRLLPRSLKLSFGSKARAVQLKGWKRLATVALESSLKSAKRAPEPVRVEVKVAASQLVGLWVKAGLSI